VRVRKKKKKAKQPKKKKKKGRVTYLEASVAAAPHAVIAAVPSVAVVSPVLVKVTF
jgi:hypothetical protein